MNELKNTKQWICHLNKVPKSPLYNGNASPTDSATWGTYEQAVEACKKYGYSGIGFVFTAETDFCGIDIDHCISENGEIHKNRNSSFDKTGQSCSGLISISSDSNDLFFNRYSMQNT